MKQFIIFLLVIITIQVNGQMHERYGDRPNKRIEQLHKIKLIETLDMDEETTLKFFSRFNKHRDQMNEIDNTGDDILLQMESKIKEGKTGELNSLIDDYLKNEQEIPKRKSEFIMSLSDILTPEQISKFLVFELRFKEEIRDIILKERRRRPE